MGMMQMGMLSLFNGIGAAIWVHCRLSMGTMPNGYDAVISSGYDDARCQMGTMPCHG
jgi:hypothetical protein